MKESAQTEVNLPAVLRAIRSAAERREALGSVTIRAAFEILDLLRRSDISGLIAEGLASADDFTRRAASGLSNADISHRDHYHVRDLIRYDDQEFVWNAYLALLRREPDDAGFHGFLQQLRDQRRNKLDILASLRYSAEGRRMKVKIRGLKGKTLIRRFFRLVGPR